jgi:uncharacterized membrane protein HdeD (DUF308 family)
MPRQFDVFIAETPDVLAVHWGWPIALGALLMALGVLAIWHARAATLIYVRFLGALLLFAALAVLVFAFSLTGYWAAFFVQVLWAILVAVVGLMLLTRPAVGAVALTMLLAIYFIAAGMLTIGFALSAHLENLWLYLFQGVVSTTIGLLLWIGRPFSGMWAIGTFVGIDLFLRGTGIVALGLALRALGK